MGPESAGKRSIEREDELRKRGLHEMADRLHESDLADMAASYDHPLRRVSGPILGYGGATE